MFDFSNYVYCVVYKEGLREGQQQAGEVYFAGLLLVAVCTPHLFGLGRKRNQRRCKCMLCSFAPSVWWIYCHIDFDSFKV